MMSRTASSPHRRPAPLPVAMLSLALLAGGCTTGSSASFTMAPLFFSEAADPNGTILADAAPAATTPLAPYGPIAQGIANYAAVSGNAVLPVNAVQPAAAPGIALAAGPPDGALLAATAAVDARFADGPAPIRFSVQPGVTLAVAGPTIDAVVAPVQVAATIDAPVAAVALPGATVTAALTPSAPAATVAVASPDAPLVATVAPAVAAPAPAGLPGVQVVATVMPAPSATVDANVANVAAPVTMAAVLPAATAPVTNVAPSVAETVAPGLPVPAAMAAAPAMQALITSQPMLPTVSMATAPVAGATPLLTVSAMNMVRMCLVSRCR